MPFSLNQAVLNNSSTIQTQDQINSIHHSLMPSLIQPTPSTPMHRKKSRYGIELYRIIPQRLVFPQFISCFPLTFFSPPLLHLSKASSSLLSICKCPKINYWFRSWFRSRRQRLFLTFTVVDNKVFTTTHTQHSILNIIRLR